MTTQFKLEDKERTIAATLQCYAPGDGSLSFVFQDHKGNATGDKVTRRDVLAFLEQRRPDLKTWTIVNLHGHGFKLFKPVTRTAPDEVQLDNRCYRYTKIHEQHFVVFNEDGREVKNLNIISQIMFYVNNERECDSAQFTL